jgi:hypothetical protein
MMQTVQHWKGSDLVPNCWRFERRYRALSIETLMGSRRIEISNLLLEYPVELTLIDDQHVV